jgi:hypothetical protein
VNKNEENIQSPARKSTEKKSKTETLPTDVEKSIKEMNGTPEDIAATEFFSELENIVDEMMFDDIEVTSGPNEQCEIPAAPSEDSTGSESVITESEIEKLEETFEVSLGQVTQAIVPEIDLDSIFEEDDPVGGRSDFASAKESDPEAKKEAEIEQISAPLHSHEAIPLVKASQNVKSPGEPGKKAELVEAVKKEKITRTGLQPIPQVEDVRQAKNKALPKTNNPKPFAAVEKETIKPVSNVRSLTSRIFKSNKQNRTPGSKDAGKHRRAVWLVGGLLIVSGIVFSHRLVLPIKATAPAKHENPAQPMTIFKIKKPVQETKNPLKPEPDLKIKQPTVPPAKAALPAVTISGNAPGPVTGITNAMIQPTAVIEGPKVETKTLAAARSPILPPAGAYPYSIHATSYRSRGEAEIDVQQYRQLGLPAFWVKTDLGKKGTWYRVFCGYFKTAEAAQKAIKTKQLQEARAYPTRHANFIGAYSSATQLEQKRQELKDRGYSPYVIGQDDGTHFLFLGGYTLRRSTEKFASELSANGIRSMVVKR